MLTCGDLCMPSVWTAARKQTCKGRQQTGEQGWPLKLGVYFIPQSIPSPPCYWSLFFSSSYPLTPHFSSFFHDTKGRLFLKSTTFHDPGAVEMVSAARWVYFSQFPIPSRGITQTKMTLSSSDPKRFCSSPHPCVPNLFYILLYLCIGDNVIFMAGEWIFVL